jgi:hypothetical protein
MKWSLVSRRPLWCRCSCRCPPASRIPGLAGSVRTSRPGSPSWPPYPATQSRQSARLFLQSSELGLSHPAGEFATHPPVLGGGAHSPAGEGWESPNSDEVTYTMVLCSLQYRTTLKINRKNTRILRSEKVEVMISIRKTLYKKRIYSL